MEPHLQLALGRPSSWHRSENLSMCKVKPKIPPMQSTCRGTFVSQPCCVHRLQITSSTAPLQGLASCTARQLPAMNKTPLCFATGLLPILVAPTGRLLCTMPRRRSSSGLGGPRPTIGDLPWPLTRAELPGIMGCCCAMLRCAQARHSSCQLLTAAVDSSTCWQHLDVPACQAASPHLCPVPQPAKFKAGHSSLCCRHLSCLQTGLMSLGAACPSMLNLLGKAAHRLGTVHASMYCWQEAAGSFQQGLELHPSNKELVSLSPAVPPPHACLSQTRLHQQPKAVLTGLAAGCMHPRPPLEHLPLAKVCGDSIQARQCVWERAGRNADSMQGAGNVGC